MFGGPLKTEDSLKFSADINLIKVRMYSGDLSPLKKPVVLGFS
jgi:hypothetical protein